MLAAVELDILPGGVVVKISATSELRAEVLTARCWFSPSTMMASAVINFEMHCANEFRSANRSHWFQAAKALMDLQTNVNYLVSSLEADAVGAYRGRACNACYLLSRLGAKAERALPALTNASQMTDRRDIAAEAISKIGAGATEMPPRRSTSAW